MLPVISLIGRTNVGKSTLFNILTKTQNALVSNDKGLTRDRQYGFCYLNDSIKTIIIDTAGLDINIKKIDKKIYKQTLTAIEECNIILFVVNAYDGLTQQEYKIAQILRKYQKEIILVINKIDSIKEKSKIYEFYSLGFKNFFCISATQNQGIKKIIINHLIPWIQKTLLKNLKNNTLIQKNYESAIKITFIGKPNSGKSTLINALLKTERMITCDQPGTTLDSISTPITYNNQNYILVDTAGASKKRKNQNKIEKFSIIKTLQSLEKTDVALLIIDAKIEISKQDLSISNFITDAKKSIVIAINKWDLLKSIEKKTLKNNIQKKLKFLAFSRIHFISALKKEGIFELFKSINEAYKNAQLKIHTAELTKIMYTATKKNAPPIIQGRRIKLKYAHLGSSNPLIIVIHGNQVNSLSAVYKRYLKNFFYNSLKIKGAVISIKFKENINPYNKKENKKYNY